MPLQSEHGQPSPPPFAPHQPRQSLFAIRNSPIPRLSWRPWLPWRPSPPCRCRSPGVLGDLGALAVHSLGSGGQPDFFPPSLPRFARHAAIAPPSRPVQRPPRTPHPHPPHLPRSPTNPRSNPHAAPFAIRHSQFPLPQSASIREIRGPSAFPASLLSPRFFASFCALCVICGSCRFSTPVRRPPARRDRHTSSRTPAQRRDSPFSLRLPAAPSPWPALPLPFPFCLA